MASSIPKNSVWAAMSYTPPRGRCNHKASLMSATCSCLRFMLHPVKAAMSFECDGCGHHASFHLMENPNEDAVIKKWTEQEAGAREQQAATGAAKKRKRISHAAINDRQVVEVLDDEVRAPEILLDEPESTCTRMMMPGIFKQSSCKSSSTGREQNTISY